MVGWPMVVHRHSHLPPLIQFAEDRHAGNELSFYLQGCFQGWHESTLGPLFYCNLHAPAVTERLKLRVVELAQKAVDMCSAMVVKAAYHH